MYSVRLHDLALGELVELRKHIAHDSPARPLIDARIFTLMYAPSPDRVVQLLLEEVDGANSPRH